MAQEEIDKVQEYNRRYDSAMATALALLAKKKFGKKIDQGSEFDDQPVEDSPA